jgi:hypothetical protein
MKNIQFFLKEYFSFCNQLQRRPGAVAQAGVSAGVKGLIRLKIKA